MEIKNVYEELGQENYSAVKDRFCGNEKLLEKFVKKFLLDPTYEKLEESVSAGDRQGIEINAHTLNGVAGNLGFCSLQSECAELVGCIRLDNNEQIPELFERVKSTYTNIIQVIKKLD